MYVVGNTFNLKKKKQVAVIVPASGEIPGFYEEISLDRCLTVLNNYDIILVAPKELNVSWYTNKCIKKKSFVVERFDDEYFGTIERHNKLLLSEVFYRRFLSYEYILIHHLDAFVFVDCLADWCNEKYYYVAAPWLQVNWHKQIFKSIVKEILLSMTPINRLKFKIIWKIKGINKNTNFLVGNGGLSLRNVKLFYEASIKYKDKLSTWRYNEDGFWSIFLPLSVLSLKLPAWKKALKFSFDVNPSICFNNNKNKLPFGCHAWFRNDFQYAGNFDFWTPLIEKEISIKINNSLTNSH